MIKVMHPGNWHNLYDWIGTSLRWLLLLVLTVAAASRGSLSPEITLVLLAAALWNAILTILAGLNRQLPALRYLSVAADMAVAYLLFFLTGTMNGGLAWVGLLPVISAALFFQIRGVVLVTAANLLFQGLLALVDNDLSDVLLFLGALLPLYLVLGGLLGYLVQQLRWFSSHSHQAQQVVRREAEKRERDRWGSLYNLILELNAGLDYDLILDKALDLSARGLAEQNGPANGLVSAVLLFSPNESGSPELRVGAARRFMPADLDIALPGSSGLIGRAIEDGEPKLSKNISKDPELTRIAALRECQAAYCLPLRSGLDTTGILLYAHPEAEFFNPQRREVLDILGDQTLISLQNAQSYRDLELEKERMTKIQDDARKKLAQELHDGPTQSVAALAMRVNFARRMIDRDAKAAADELLKIEDLARQTTKEIRQMLFALRPQVLESQGLIPALQSMAEMMHDVFNQQVTVDADPETVTRLNAGKQVAIFHIVEEAVNNARKHARANHVWVRIKPAEEDLVRLEVQDDGIGFDARSIQKRNHSHGSPDTVNMRERAELLNGILTIDSPNGRGTSVRLTIPLTEESSKRLRRSS